MKWLANLVLVALLSGCAAPVARTASTPSGKPEIQIDGRNLEEVRGKIIEGVLAKGYSMDADSPSRIVISKEVDGSREALLRLLISNSYSTPVRAEHTFTLVKNEPGVHVYVTSRYVSTMPMGQVRSIPADGNQDFNTVQQSLERLKETITASTP